MDTRSCSAPGYADASPPDSVDRTDRDRRQNVSHPADGSITIAGIKSMIDRQLRRSQLPEDLAALRRDRRDVGTGLEWISLAGLQLAAVGRQAGPTGGPVVVPPVVVGRLVSTYLTQLHDQTVF